MDDLSTKTVEQLEALLTDLYGEMKAVKAKKRAVSEELQRRAAVAEVQRALAGLSPGARALISPKGIAPGGVVGTPGAA